MQPTHFRILFVFTPLVFAITGCSETLHSQRTIPIKTSSESIAYPEADTVLGEKLQSNEEALAQNIAQVIEKSIREQYTAGNALRDAHPKAHGCVRAEFHVSKKIYLLSLLKEFLSQIKVIKHGFVFQMHLMTPRVPTLTKMHAESP